MSSIKFTVNGTECCVDTRIPRETSLNAYLRYHLALMGTKAMCHQGNCGACVVAVRAYNHTTEKIETFSVNSCLVLVFTCQGWEITTIEGLGNKQTGYHQIQLRTAKFNATQCGYCTCGWEMQLYSLLDKNLTMAEMEDSFASNTCRCTGYRPIMVTAKSFATDASAELCDVVRDIEDLYACKNAQNSCERRCSIGSNCSDWSVINELAIPSTNSDVIEMHFEDNTMKKKYIKVYTEAQIFETLKNVGLDSYMLLDGNTSRGYLGTNIYDLPRIIIDIRDVKSLKQNKFDQNLVLGANMAIQDCITLFKDVAKSRNEFAYLAELAKHMLLVAHIPVRKIGSLAGNLMTKHKKPDFESDIFVLFTAVDATVTVKNIFGTEKELSMPEFLKYDMTGNLILCFRLPPFGPSHEFRSYKIMARSQNATALVNAGFLIIFSAQKIVQRMNIVYGNISESFIHAVRTEAYLVGKNIFNDRVLQGAIKILNEEVIPDSDPAKPSRECRKKLAMGLFYKFVLNISPNGLPSPRLRSGGFLLDRPLSSGKQEYQTDPSLYPITQPVQKYEGLIQSSGEALFTNDIPPMKNEVFAAFVLSTVHSAEIDHIDACEALKIDGVLKLFTAKDFPGVNSFILPGLPLLTDDEEILASNKVIFCGQPVGIIVAVSEALAAKAATMVEVTYKNRSDALPVLTIDEAKKDSKRLVPSDLKIVPKARGTNTTKIIKGVYETDAQYQYYMEPIACVVVPVDGRLTVYATSMWPDLTQIAIARCLNMKQNDIVVRVHRLGGGFGGKLTRGEQVFTSCALVATNMTRPCRFILPFSTNITIGGKRLQSQWEYEVGIDNNGKIQYVDASLIEAIGYCNNDTVLGHVISAFPNCYNKDYFSLKTSTVLTDLPSSTFMRAPGTTESIATIEHIIDHIAFVLNIDPTDIRLLNMRKEDNDLPQMIDTLKKKADYDTRYNKIKQFNKANRWIKKAIKINVMVFPVKYFNNYSAMICIYKGDGSVTVSTGGVEVGQGANTKVRQVVAYELGISIEKVTVLPCVTYVAANNSFTGGSIVSECICYAAIKACKILKDRLKPISDSLTNATWLEIIEKAGELQVDLVAEYMMSDKEPDLAKYDAFAVAILEGELDVLTGKYILNRLDLVEDVGRSISPAIDIGQVEGGYMQGLGLFTTEKLIYNKETGKLLTNDGLSYFVYLPKDIPVEINVMLKENSKNPNGVLGSKAVGEMGVASAHGVTHVLRQCIMESRKDSGYDPREWINIDIPYTTESILKALNVKPSELTITKELLEKSNLM